MKRVRVELLDSRLCDLDLKLSPQIKRGLRQLKKELKARGLNFFPKVWISSEWFSPDGVAGFAVPFYLCRHDLLLLQKKIMGEAEGESFKELMNILRHETGHAIENAFGLRRLKLRQATFGISSTPYPNRYLPDPNRREFVHNLNGFYAQAHPDEDFAETFAVWLSGKTRRYAGTPAEEKLKAVESLMEQVKGRKARGSLHAFEAVEELNSTLKAHYSRILRKRRQTLLDFAEIAGENVRAGKSQHFRWPRNWKERICDDLAKSTAQDRFFIEGFLQTWTLRPRGVDRCGTLTYSGLKQMLERQSRTYFRKGLHQIII